MKIYSRLLSAAVMIEAIRVKHNGSYSQRLVCVLCKAAASVMIDVQFKKKIVQNMLLTLILFNATKLS